MGNSHLLIHTVHWESSMHINCNEHDQWRRARFIMVEGNCPSTAAKVMLGGTGYQRWMPAPCPGFFWQWSRVECPFFDERFVYVFEWRCGTELQGCVYLLLCLLLFWQQADSFHLLPNVTTGKYLGVQGNRQLPHIILPGCSLYVGWKVSCFPSAGAFNEQLGRGQGSVV